MPHATILDDSPDGEDYGGDYQSQEDPFYHGIIPDIFPFQRCWLRIEQRDVTEFGTSERFGGHGRIRLRIVHIVMIVWLYLNNP